MSRVITISIGFAQCFQVVIQYSHGKLPLSCSLFYAVKVRAQRLDDLKHGRHLDERENPSFAVIAQRYLNTVKLAKLARTLL